MADHAELTRPIVGIENRTAQEVFDIMADRIRHALRSHPAAVKGDAEAARDALRELALIKMDLPLEDWCRILSALEPAALSKQEAVAISAESAAHRIATWLECDDESVRPDGLSEKTERIFRSYRLKLAKAIREAYPVPAEPSAEGWRSRAADDVLAERRRQVEAEGWSPERDDEYTGEQLASAASCYALPNPYPDHERGVPADWPWSMRWWKPTTRRRDLVKAGALILAEIERLDRLPPAPHGEGA